MMPTRHFKHNSLYLECSEVSSFWLQSLWQASSTLLSKIAKEQAGHQWMNTWIKAACEELLSSDVDSITQDLRDPADPGESSCKQNREIKLQLHWQSSPWLFPAPQYLVLKTYIICIYVPKLTFKVLNISTFKLCIEDLYLSGICLHRKSVHTFALTNGCHLFKPDLRVLENQGLFGTFFHSPQVPSVTLCF